jgi:hypothetical protein
MRAGAAHGFPGLGREVECHEFRESSAAPDDRTTLYHGRTPKRSPPKLTPRRLASRTVT